MAPRSLRLTCLGWAYAALMVLVGPAPCRAAATYSFTDLGLSDGGNPTFDAQGRVNPTSISPEEYVRRRSGPYSISWHYGQAPPHELQRALALADGQDPVEIQPPAWSVYQATVGSAVNDSGTYVGTAYGRFGNGFLGEAFMFTRDGGSRAVPVPYAGLSSALSINDAGLIVGVSSGPGVPFARAFLSDGVSSWDLNTLADPGKDFLLTSATDINGRGQILGTAMDTVDYSTHYYLLTPTATATPEPSTLLLLAQGGLLCYWRRRAGRQ